MAAPPAAGVRAISRTVTTVNRSTELQPVLTVGVLSLANNQGGVAATPDQFEWLRNVRLPPVPQAASVEELLRFDTQPGTLKTSPAIYRSGRPMQMQAEFVGFEFKK
jgi:hypothetical protein